MKDNETYVAGRSAERARELLDLADAAGMPASVVRTTSGGYIVPTSLVEKDSTPAKGDDGAGDEQSEAKDAKPKRSRSRAKKEN